MKIFFFSLYFYLYHLFSVVNCCLFDEEVHRDLLATKTPYRFVSNGKIENPSVPNCQPLQTWMFSRHATRYPQDKDIKRFKNFSKTRDKIIESHEEGRGHLCDGDIENLKNWTQLPNVTLSTPDIATEGWREGHELGRIYKNAFPTLLPSSDEDMNSQNYVFNSKRGRRAEYSMYAFMEGLFGSKSAVEPAPFLKPNYILQPEKNCPLWSHSVPSDCSECDGFIDGPDYAEMKANVSRRLGFEVTRDEIYNMQDMCRYETAWIRNYTSPWCGIFTEDEWKILEYIDDLKCYYEAADYGVPVNSLLSCFAVQDMLDNFREIETGETHGKPRAIFYFGNSKLLLGLLSALEIGKDTEILRANNFKELPDRKWRTSRLSPFFGNLLATFYRCQDGNSSNKVTFHLQERLVTLEGCENGVCDWNYLKMKFSKPPRQCIENCVYRRM